VQLMFPTQNVGIQPRTEAGSLVFGVGKNLTANHTYTAGVSTF